MSFVFLPQTAPFVGQKPIYNDLEIGSHATSAIEALLAWYNNGTGTWDTTGWWNSANALTTLADFSAINPGLNATILEIYQNTFQRAQEASCSIVKTITPHSIDSKASTASTDVYGSPRFLNDYYDDEGWYCYPVRSLESTAFTDHDNRWALAWLKVYDNTAKTQYLDAAKSIFSDLIAGRNAPCGGLWWDKAHTYSGAIENELFLVVAAQLANRVSTVSEKEHYLDWAWTQWDWFQLSGMINSNHTINNGLDMATCSNDNGTIWSYNQGVILGGLVELHRALPHPEYLRMAEKIASAAIDQLSDQHGILHDPCEPDCGNDGPQFKGIFMRNLQILHGVRPTRKLERFIRKNAQSIWQKDRGDSHRLGLVWSGPFTGATASTQSSACDALVAALSLDMT